MHAPCCPAPFHLHHAMRCVRCPTCPAPFDLHHAMLACAVPPVLPETQKNSCLLSDPSRTFRIFHLFPLHRRAPSHGCAAASFAIACPPLQLNCDVLRSLVHRLHAASRPRHARGVQLSLRLRVNRQARGARPCADAAAACGHKRGRGAEGGSGAGPSSAACRRRAAYGRAQLTGAHLCLGVVSAHAQRWILHQPAVVGRPRRQRRPPAAAPPLTPAGRRAGWCCSSSAGGGSRAQAGL